MLIMLIQFYALINSSFLSILLRYAIQLDYSSQSFR